LTPATSYTFRVRAFNDTGFSAYSEATGTTLPFVVQPPAAPVLSANVVSHDQVNLSWEFQENTTSYKIDRKIFGALDWTEIAALNSVTIRHPDMGLSPSTHYIYRVRAFNSAGESASAEVTVFTPAVPQPPVAPVLQARATSPSEIQLSWNDVGDETSYLLERLVNGTEVWIVLGTPPADSTGFTNGGLTPSTEYVYRVRARNSAGDSVPSAEVRATTLPGPTEFATVNFLQVDSATSGLWPMDYGWEGNAIAGFVGNFPVDVSVDIARDREVTWAKSSTDARAPVVPGGTARTAAAWAGDALTLNLNLDVEKKVALYFLDWERAGLSQRLTIRDKATGTVLDERVIDSFGNGKYVVYNINGEVEMTVTATSGAEALLSAILIGNGMPAPIGDRPLSLEVLGANSFAVKLRISGDTGQRFRIQSSDDFSGWNDVAESLMLGSEIDIEVNPPAGSARMFYRTVNGR
jgi:hypothetical protein